MIFQTVALTVIGDVYFPKSALREPMIAVGTTISVVVLSSAVYLVRLFRECRDQPDYSVLEDHFRRRRAKHREKFDVLAGTCLWCARLTQASSWIRN